MSFPSIPQRLIASLGAALLTLPLSACGGGGSSRDAAAPADEVPPITAGPVAGAYTLALMSASRSDALSVDTTWGSIQFDSALGQAESSTQHNDHGRLDLDPEQAFMQLERRDIPGTYGLYDARLGPDWSLDLARTPDNSVMGIMSMREGWSPSMGVLVQRSRGMTRADVEGDYHLLGHEYNSSTRDASVFRGVVAVNAVEAKAQYWLRMIRGRRQEQRRLQFSVEDDGTSAPGQELQGGFRPEGDFAAFVGSADPERPKLLQQLYMIRFGQGLTRASLEGDYTLHRLNLLTPVPSASLGVVSFSGTGLMSYQVQRENLGGVARQGGEPRLGSYFVLDHGEVRIRVGAFDHFDGAMTQDGEVVVLGSYGTDDAPHTILVLLKR